MEGYRTDEEQVEHLKKWWEENGKSVIGGIVIGMVAIFGWRGWQQHEMTQAMSASNLYENLAVELNRGEDGDINKVAEQLNQEYQSTPYSTFATLMQARQAVEKDDIETAKQHLQSVLDNAKSDEFKHLARLRLARLTLVEGDQDAALALIDNVDAGKFAASYYELRGDILLQQGDTSAARDAYNQALANQNSVSGNQAIVQIKLDDLGAQQL